MSLYSYDKPLSSNVYNSDYSNDIRDARAKYYAEQKKNSNIVAPYFRSILSRDNETIGPVPSDTRYEIKSNGFDKQFNLCTFDRVGKPAGINEQWTSKTEEINPAIDRNYTSFNTNKDMTYGVVESDQFIFENMVPFTNSKIELLMIKIHMDHNCCLDTLV